MYLRNEWSKVNDFLISSILIGHISQLHNEMVRIIAKWMRNFVLMVISKRFYIDFIRRKNAKNKLSFRLIDLLKGSVGPLWNFILLHYYLCKHMIIDAREVIKFTRFAMNSNVEFMYLMVIIIISNYFR